MPASPYDINLMSNSTNPTLCPVRGSNKSTDSFLKPKEAGRDESSPTFCGLEEGVRGRGRVRGEGSENVCEHLSVN